jgi:hypothetical protein
MQWLTAWWRQIAGHPGADPWRDDPRIRDERQGQHERINKATAYSLRDQYNERLRESWRPLHRDT